MTEMYLSWISLKRCWKIISDSFISPSYPLVLVAHCVWSFNWIVDVPPVTGAHRFVVGSTERAEPVTSVKQRR